MKILVVDDSIFVRMCLKKYLLELLPNAELEYASSGEEGYNFYIEKKPSVIITDLLMPGMGGQAFISKIRKNDQKTKIIVLTADIQKTVKEEIKALRVSAFLNKPITRESILAIRNIIEG